MSRQNEKTCAELIKENADLREKLESQQESLREAQETLEAIKSGAIDGLVRSTPEGEQVFVLSGSEEPYRKLIEEMDEGAVLVSSSGVILYANMGFSNLIDFPLEQIIGSNIAQWIADRNIDSILQMLAETDQKSHEVFFVSLKSRNDKKLVPAQVTVSGLAFGSVDACALIITDLSKHMDQELKHYTTNLEGEVTERKKAEEALKQTQTKLEENAVQLEEYANQMEDLAAQRAEQLKEQERMVAIGQTAGMVGHDLKNPLQAIIGELYFAKKDLSKLPSSETVEEIKGSLNEINASVNYMNKIVVDLQDFARPLKPEFVETDLSDVVTSVFKTVSLPDNIELRVSLNNVQRFRTDAAFIRRALTNLVNNGIQAMPDGGTLKIEGCKRGDRIFLTVSDTGMGIPEEIKARLFTPMVTTKAKGQGFGLAVVKRLVESLNGTVNFESQQGKGTNFKIELPIKQ